MKNKIISIAAVFALLLMAYAASSFNFPDKARVHQHMEYLSSNASVTNECSHKAGEFCTHLPIISVDTGENELFKEITDEESYTAAEGSTVKHGYEYPVVGGSMAVYDRQGINNHITDDPTDISFIEINCRGNSSLLFDKKSYSIDLVYRNGEENKDIGLVGMPKHDKWVLNGPFLDKTLLRNYLCFNVAGEALGDTPEVRFCELFLNGEYQGVYLATESVSRGGERVNIDKLDPKEPYTPYLLRADRTDTKRSTISNFSKYTRRMHFNTSFEVLYPGTRQVTPEVIKYIEDDFNVFEKSLYSFDYKDKQLGYQNYIDVESFVDYFIINEFFQNYDAGIFSTYLYKDVKGKIHMGPVWDFNNACDNYIEMSYATNGFGMIDYARYSMLFRDKRFVKNVINRYKELREGCLNEQYLMSYIDDTVQFLGAAVDRNYSVWGYSFDVNKLEHDQFLEPVSRNPKDYNEAIAQLKSAITERGKWLDKNIELLNQYSHESKVKKFEH